MVNLTDADIVRLRTTLQDAVVKCSERCLYQSAKWAAELATSLPSTSEPETTLDSDADSQMSNADTEAAPPPIVLSANTDPHEARLEAQEAGKYLLAKSYFDCREYDRCAAIFLPSNLPRGPLNTAPRADIFTDPISPQSTHKGKGKAKATDSDANASMASSESAFPRMSQKALFLSLYAKYLSGEKRKDEESEMILGPADGGTTMNRELVGLSRGLESWFAERERKSSATGEENSSQGWLEYLYGIVLAKGKNEAEAKKWLLKSVNLYPYNWGAWQELSDLLGSLEDLAQIINDLPRNIMTFLFHLHASQELYQATDEIHSELSQLEAVFPGSQWLKTERALLLYHSKDFEEAESVFSTIVENDPHRIDALDHYSNILYVMTLRPKLAYIAQLATATDKFRPETCCVVGNYYSLKSEHEKAVMYFRRALTLDRSFLSAWTLMGHEYVEMKNTHAAIESYRRAVDVNRKDYRAWYGLGQTYEVLEMHYYALFYYQRAASLRPYDPKMWQAVGSCYNKMGRPLQAIKALKRALVAGSYYDVPVNTSTTTQQGGVLGEKRTMVQAPMDPETLYQIALMYEKMHNLDEAAAYMELTLAQEDGIGGDGDADEDEDEEYDDTDEEEYDDDEDWEGKENDDRENTDADLGADMNDHDDEQNLQGTAGAATGTTTTTTTTTTTRPARRTTKPQRNNRRRQKRGTDPNTKKPPRNNNIPIRPATAGVGVTSTTSRARMWLARWEFSRGGPAGYQRAMQLATELCQDGVEVEEAKALVRDLRARIEMESSAPGPGSGSGFGGSSSFGPGPGLGSSTSSGLGFSSGPGPGSGIGPGSGFGPGPGPAGFGSSYGHHAAGNNAGFGGGGRRSSTSSYGPGRSSFGTG
ncbi:TPR-like protein [Xylona heveae TC161]|uniref:TPR-like protein n=1 Tax=Xylona heveae (strain CBS 132557 / TC161) TaxID=1328760 RepID=A0A165AB59_XYLHT|nr:TPR-like protein [Xylona heveae TC161]KZF20198.1 TPR-like protein [Xylona heveae TC161]